MFPLQIADLELPFRYFLNNGAVRMQFFFFLQYKEKVLVGSKCHLSLVLENMISIIG